MPTRVKLPDGSTADFPDGMGPTDIQSALDQQFGSKTPPPQASGSVPTTLMSKLEVAGDKAEAAASPAVDFVARNSNATDLIAGPDNLVADTSARLGHNLLHMVTHPVDAVTGIAKSTTPYRIATSPDLKSLVSSDPTVEQGRQFVDTARTQGLRKAGTDAAGDLLTGAVVGEGLGAIPGIGADLANSVGSGLKRAGSLVDRLTVGAPAPSDNLGADAGAALSSNRIVGASPRSLVRQAEAHVGPMADARDAILARSPVSTDVAPITQAPFDELAGPKVDPKTGAARPGNLRTMDTVRRAIQNVQEPDGTITDTLKDTSLTPSELGRLQSNVYDMADYQTPDSDLANQYVKKVGAGLKDAVNAAAPEASTMTDSLHDMLGAKGHLESRVGAPPAATDLGPGKIAGKLYDRLRYGLGTATGAGLDLAGSSLKEVGGLLRRVHTAFSPTSPVAPAPSTPPPNLRQPLQLEANTPTDAPGAGPEDIAPGGTDPQRSPVTTPPPLSPKLLDRVSSPSQSPTPSPVGIPHPGTVDPGLASTRLQPTTFAARPEVIPPRKLTVGPDGQVSLDPRGELPAPAPTLLLESTTGRAAPSANRPGVLQRFLAEAEAGAKGLRMRDGKVVKAGQRKLADTPEAQSASPAVVPPTLASRVAKPPTPARLPAPDDIDGWEALVDEGHARYNTHTHSYDYTGPIKGQR